MNATYIPSSFAAENSKHTQAIHSLKGTLMSLDPTTTFIEHPGKNNLGYDLTINGLNVEIKTNSGVNARTGTGYATWLLETFCDHDCNKFPEWATCDQLDHLIIINRHASTAYVYDVKLLRSYVAANIAAMVPSGLGSGQYSKGTTLCGWGLKLPWICEAAGFIGSIELGG